MLPLYLGILLLTSIATSQPTTEKNGAQLPIVKNQNVDALTKESNLERVNVKHESGFDGKVRSIRFSLDPGDDTRDVETGFPTNKQVKPIDSSKMEKSGKTKRSITDSSSSEFNDLQAEEAKVFRPLFVYRQQVARRVKLQNDKRPYDYQRRVQRMKPYYYNYNYYYPYRNAPYQQL